MKCFVLGFEEYNPGSAKDKVLFFKDGKYFEFYESIELVQ